LIIFASLNEKFSKSKIFIFLVQRRDTHRNIVPLSWLHRFLSSQVSPHETESHNPFEGSQRVSLATPVFSSLKTSKIADIFQKILLFNKADRPSLNQIESNQTIFDSRKSASSARFFICFARIPQNPTNKDREEKESNHFGFHFCFKFFDLFTFG